MHKKIGSLILTFCLLLALTPETVMAATMERTPIFIQETSAPAEPVNQTAPTEQPKAAKKQPEAAVSPNLEGSGTTADPYRIKDAAQLRMFTDAVNGVGGAPNTGICATLTQNINLSDVCGPDTGSWTPIGTNTNPYRGTFDGGSFTVSGLYCQKPGASYAGLFGSNAGVIKNLGVAGGSVSAGSYAGGLCGINKGTITGCYNTASVNGDKYTGGICGCNDNGATVSVCYNTSAINGSKYVGGICGYNKNATSDCYNTGTVTGSGTSIGGICGYNKNLVSGCYNTGEVGGGTGYVGSICGYNHSGSTFVNCYYLITGTEKGNYGTGMTQQQFTSGEVCYALNEGNGGSVAWKQTCGTGLPGFGGKTVYRAQTYKGDGSTVFAYTNDSNKKAAAYNAPAPYTAPSVDNSTENTSDNSGEHTHVYQEPKWNWKKYESAKATLICQDCGEEFILKASVKKEVTEPTCTEDGETVYTASVERDGVTFKDKKVVEKERTGHDPKPISKGPASCTDPQYIMDFDCYKCANCHKYFEDEKCKKPIDKKKVEGTAKPTGHKLDIVWDAWKTTSTPRSISISATITCQNSGCNLSSNADVKLKRIDIIPASCTSEGQETYKATATFEGKTFHNPQLGTLPLPTVDHKYNNQGVCSVCGHKKTETTSSETKGTLDPNAKCEELPPDEALPDGEAPSLLPGTEEIPEVSTPPEEQDGSGEADTPEAPDDSDSVNTPDSPDVPDTSGGQDTTETPDKPGSADGSDIPVAPGDTNGQDTPNPPDTPDTSGSANTPNVPGESDAPDGANDLIYPEEEGVLIEGTAASLQSTAAVKSMTQPVGDQQEMSLWGSGIVLMLLVGAALLIILRKRHNE